MALPKLSVIDSGNNIVSINTMPDSGQVNSSNSISVVVANDQIVPVKTGYSVNSVVIVVAANTTSNNVLITNLFRKKYSVYNDSGLIAYLLENEGSASNTFYTRQLAPDAFYTSSDWSGPVSIAWSSNTGSAKFTEYYFSNAINIPTSVQLQ